MKIIHSRVYSQVPKGDHMHVQPSRIQSEPMAHCKLSQGCLSSRLSYMQAITLGAIGFAATADVYDRTYGQVCC